jgi:hypothetical protein
MSVNGVSNGKPFPRSTLFAAAAVPLSIVALAFLAQAMGHEWNVHGDALFVMGWVLITSVVALIVELVTLPGALKRLYRLRAERTAINLLSAAVAGGFVIACLSYGVFVVRSIASSGT